MPDDQGLAVWEIYDRFLARGVPTRMATLFLLAFVRRVSEHAELTIKATAKLTLDSRHDTPISLTSGEIHLISTFSQVADGLPFERLAKSRQVPFGEAIDWLKAIDPTLKPTNSAEEIAGQGQRVVELARQLAEPVARVSATLQELGQAIGSRVPQDVQDALDVVASLSDVTNFADIYKLAKDRYQDEDAFTQVINHFRAAEALAFDAGSIRAAHEYLGDLSGHLDGAHE